MSRKSGDADFIMWFFVIALAVTCGNLLSTWVTAQVAAYQVRKAAEEVSRRLEEQNAKNEAERRTLNAAKAEQDRERKEQMRRVRASGPVGQRLTRECQDWARAVDKTPTATTRTQAERHCRKLEQYLDSGIWDPKLND